MGGEERGDVVRGFVADAAVGAAFALGAFDDVPEREAVGEDEAVARVEAGVGRFAPCAVDYFPEFILLVRVVASSSAGLDYDFHNDLQNSVCMELYIAMIREAARANLNLIAPSYSCRRMKNSYPDFR